MVAVELAARHPELVSGAVLIDGGLIPLRAAMDWPTTKQRLAPPRLAGMTLDEFRVMIPTFFDGSVEMTSDVEDIVLSVMRFRRDGTISPYLSRANHFRILRAIWERDPVALYRRLAVPTLAIVAHPGGRARTHEERDLAKARRVSVAAVKVAARGRPLWISWMEGIHDLPLQHPDELARRIERFAADAVG